MSPRAKDRLSGLLLGALGIALFLAAWEVVGQRRMLGLSWPPLTTVVEFLTSPQRRPLFQRALGASLASLLTGYAAGTAAGLALAALGYVLRPMREGLDRMAAFIHAIPSIAVAPLFILLLSREDTPAALAALAAFFIVYVSASSGLAASTPALRDLFAVLGGSRWSRFLRLDLPAALPTIAAGLRLAAPSALIGVIIGEWFGAPRGLGVLVINAMQNFQIPLLWSTVLLAVITSLVLFSLLGLVQRAAQARFR